MKRNPATDAFTLIELLVATAVLALVVVLAAQVTSATLTTVSHSSHTLETSESVRAVTMMLRDELSGVTARNERARYLNLRVNEDDERVALFFTVPRASTADLSRMGFVTHVAYVWDRATCTLGRAEYHASREPEAVAATASNPHSTDMRANLNRLRALTPAYNGDKPFAWTEHALWEERLEEARRNPLLTGVAEWKVECFEDTELDEDNGSNRTLNDWQHDDRLPVAMRFSFIIRPGAQRAKAKDENKETIGRRYEAIVPLPGAEVAK